MSLLAGVVAAAAQPDAPWPPAAPLAVVAEGPPAGLPPSVQARATGDGAFVCTFEYLFPPQTAMPAPRSVALAGTFNGWNRDALPLQESNGSWRAEIRLAPGAYEYKFVIDGDRWIADPRNPSGADDGHQGANSLLRLGRLAGLERSDAARGDGKIDTLALEHRPQQPFFLQRVDDAHVLLRYRMLAGDAERVSVQFRGAAPVELQLLDEGPVYAIYEGRAALPAAAAASGVAEYVFILRDAALEGTDPSMHKVSLGQQIAFNTPDWARHAVWYQIMVDRFRNGSPANDPPHTRPWTSEWFTPSPWEGADGQTFYRHFVFKRLYGGDLAGLESKLPYLRELGVNALYLNPVFIAESHHKYDATNYLHIDPHFGEKNDYDAIAAAEDLNDPKTWQWTDADRRFLAFIGKAHELGFRVIIDGVWNHVGQPHPAFQDVLKNGEASRYADWFDVESWSPFKHRGWAGHDSLPVFRKSKNGLASAAVKQHIFNVTRRWMDPNGDGDPSDGVDGWRLDVPNEIALPFWAEWRTLVKSINPEAYICGEIWDRADEWLDGRHFDAVMNYEFARVAVALICHDQKQMKPSQADRKLRELRLAYPLAATQVMQNLVDSHDTDRLVSMALNPDRAYDRDNRVQDDNPNYNNARPGPQHYARARLVAFFQMTYVGAPMIYYGDEVGMWGADDPTNRKPMLWADLQPYDKPEENAVMEDHFAYYRTLIALRNAHPALRTGAFTTLKTDDKAHTWVFARADEDEQLIVALNASDQTHCTHVTLPREYPSGWTVVFGPADAASAARGELTIALEPWSGVVLRGER